MRVAYLGPPGTFSEEALVATAPGAVEPVSLGSVRLAVLAVQEGDAERALVPVESATEGSVDETLDTLAADAPDVVIVGEAVRPVHLHLVGRPGLEPAEVDEVVSHPQALAQCARFLRDLGAATVPAASTAEAVRSVGAGEHPAAIGTRRAAELYGCAVLRSEVEDNPDNRTRFAWLARAGEAAEPSVGRPSALKTSLVFSGPGTDEAGWLVRCLSEFAFRGVNLTRIESRPRRAELGAYMFFVDCEGGTGEERVAEAVEGLRAHCDHVRVLGSYPAA